MAQQGAQHCIECFAFTPEELALPEDDRRRLVGARVKSADTFVPCALAGQAPLSFAEGAAVLIAFIALMGGPLLLLASGMACVVCGSLRAGAAWCTVLALVLHPLRDCATPIRRSWFARSLYRYFSYRILWRGDTQDARACWGAKSPDGALPLTHLLSIAAINTSSFRCSLGATGTVVSRSPFLRHISLGGSGGADCGGGLGNGNGNGVLGGAIRQRGVGLVDGIAGIFQTRDTDEVHYSLLRHFS